MITFLIYYTACVFLCLVTLKLANCSKSFKKVSILDDEGNYKLLIYSTLIPFFNTIHLFCILVIIVFYTLQTISSKTQLLKRIQKIVK